MSSPALQIRSRVPRLAGAAVERARLTVVPRRRTTTSRAPFLALVSLVLLGGVVGLLLFNTSMQQASFATTALEQQSTRLAAREQSLGMDLDRLRDPQRIASAAQRLGMVQACSPAFLQLGTGKVTGAPCAESAPLRIWDAPAKPASLNPKTKIVHVEAPPATTTTTTNSSGDTAAGNAGRAAGDGKKKNR
jgi:Flp pilus assembly protein TadG